jgi:hypothetical protein
LRAAEPKKCPSCQSYYWKDGKNKEGVNMPLGKRQSKYGFDKIHYKNVVVLPWYFTEDGKNFDSEKNSKRWYALDRYMKRHGYKFIVEPDIRTGLKVIRLS